MFHLTESEIDEEYHSLLIEFSPFKEMIMTYHHSAPSTITLQLEKENMNYQQCIEFLVSNLLLKAMLMQRDSFGRAHYSMSMEAANKEYQHPHVA